MNYTTKSHRQKPTSRLRIAAITLLALIFIAIQSSSVNAQWTTPNGNNNINNTNTGNVGIGTTSPTDKLEVSASSGNIGARISSGNLSTDYSALRLHQGGAEKGVIFTNQENLFIRRSSTGHLLLNDTGGNVGIGTTSPGRPLVVTADASGIPLRVYRNANHIGWGTGIQWAFNNSSGNVADYAYVNSTIVNNTAGAENGTLGFFTAKAGTLTQQAVIDQNGNVGIGTTGPDTYGLLTLNKSSAYGIALQNSGTTKTYLGQVFVPGDWFPGSSVGDFAIRSQGGNIGLSTDASGGMPNMYLKNGGKVGIGTVSPTKELDVVGDVNASGTITGGTIVAKYQDVAEWVPATHALPAGTVVTLDPTKSNHVEASSRAYDTRVAGVISAQPGIVLGERGENKVLVATTGRVRIKVDASQGPIEVGDLLVTSGTLGLAMKSQPINVGGVHIHRPGTLIGKALEPLAKGRGEILVLLSLQ